MQMHIRILWFWFQDQASNYSIEPQMYKLLKHYAAFSLQKSQLLAKYFWNTLYTYTLPDKVIVNVTTLTRFKEVFNLGM